jgi:hypothetical protein
MSELTLREGLPEVGRAERLANEAHAIANAISVDSPAMYECAGDELRGIKARKDQINELRMSLTRPLDESKKRIIDLFRVPVDRLDAAEGILRRAMLEYHAIEQRKADEARRAAEAKAREERAALERARQEAQKAGDAEAAEAAEHAIEIAEIAPVAVIAPAQAKANGIATRENWRAEVVDFKALVIAAGQAAEAGDDTLSGYLCVDTKALGGVARALKGAAKIPGVRVYCEESLSVRTA